MMKTQLKSGCALLGATTLMGLSLGSVQNAAPAATVRVSEGINSPRRL